MHIHQIGTEGDSYTVVDDLRLSDLTQHPAILEHPEFFEVSKEDLPEKYQILNYAVAVDPLAEINQKIAALEADVSEIKGA